MNHIFVDEKSIDLNAKTITLMIDDDIDTFNHITKSLRINEGEKLLCSINSFEFSFDYLCEVTNISKESVKLSIIEETASRELPVKINLYQGISKSDKLEYIIEKSVELGVNTITPVSSEYCVAKIDDKKADKKIERFNKIAKSAAEQSKRHIIPKVYEPIRLEDLLNSKKEASDKTEYNILFYENAEGIVNTKELLEQIKRQISDKTDMAINIIIGPEGGFSDKEIEMARLSGFHILSLGDRILRTETAAVTALSIIMYEMS